MIRIGISKEQRINSEHHHDAMIKMTTSERAKYWFHRKPYAAFELRRGDSGEQKNIKSISGISEGNTKNQE